MIRDSDALLDALRAVHAELRAAVLAASDSAPVEELSAVVADGEGDTVFALDRIGEERLARLFAPIAERWPLRLIAEGVPEPGIELPAGGSRPPEVVVVVDPVDGTRGLMYHKRSAWILTGVAPVRGRTPTLADIELAVQTEIPLPKQHLGDVLWARRGHGCRAERFDRLTGRSAPLRLRPSRATTVAQGFGGLARFVPGGRQRLAAIDDFVYERLLGRPRPGKAQAFEDQYISSGGQLYELMAGHDRWVADLRPLVSAGPGGHGLCARPYDLCTELIAREAGVIVTDAAGGPLDAPLDTVTDVAWVAYANAALRAQVEPVLRQALSHDTGAGPGIDPTIGEVTESYPS